MTPVRAWRLCPDCRIRWDKAKQKECPKCKVGAFFTMNLGDIGTFVFLENSGLSDADFAVVEVTP